MFLVFGITYLVFVSVNSSQLIISTLFLPRLQSRTSSRPQHKVTHLKYHLSCKHTQVRGKNILKEQEFEFCENSLAHVDTNLPQPQIKKYNTDARSIFKSYKAEFFRWPNIPHDFFCWEREVWVKCFDLLR